MSGDISRFTTF